jgi:hypothetical protein
VVVSVADARRLLDAATPLVPDERPLDADEKLSTARSAGPSTTDARAWISHRARALERSERHQHEPAEHGSDTEGAWRQTGQRQAQTPRARPTRALGGLRPTKRCGWYLGA